VSDHTALVQRLAVRIRERGLTGPAILALELCRPLGFLGSQLMLMFGPLFGAAGDGRYADYAGLLEDRRAVDQLLTALETAAPPADQA
jgi:hypothetical protein